MRGFTRRSFEIAAHSAGSLFDELRKKYPDYYYRDRGASAVVISH